MNVPKLDKVQSVVLIGAVIAGVYVIYRASKMGGEVAAQISGTVGAGIDAVQNGVARVYHAVIPAEIRAPALKDLPSGGDYPENFGGIIYGGSQHATPAEVDAYFGKGSPDAMGNPL
jgi:hypothetical protein